MRRRIHVCNMGRKIHAISSYKVYGLGCSAQASGTGFALVQQLQRECVLFIGTQFSNLYTAVDTPAEAA